MTMEENKRTTIFAKQIRQENVYTLHTLHRIDEEEERRQRRNKRQTKMKNVEFC